MTLAGNTVVDENKTLANRPSLYLLSHDQGLQVGNLSYVLKYNQNIPESRDAVSRWLFEV